MTQASFGRRLPDSNGENFRSPLLARIDYNPQMPIEYID
jgi:hypothetical protein